MKKIVAPVDGSLDAIRASMLSNLSRVVGMGQMRTETSSAAGLVIHYHSLGVAPSLTAPFCIYALPWDDARVWATEDDRRQWNAQQVVFHISANLTRVDVAVGLR